MNISKIKSLIHYGVYIPKYNPIGLSIRSKVNNKEYSLSPLAEQLVIQFVKKFDTDYIKDEVFVRNFLSDLVKELKLTPDSRLLSLKNWDFSKVQDYLERVKEKTNSMSKEEKKLARELKKKLREKLKEKYAYALINGERVPIMNWTVEPPSIFLSKGKNPLRGHWKKGVKREEITLNLSERPEGLEEGWKEIVFRPKELWIARWKCPLTGKTKYSWLAFSSPQRQKRAKEKWDLALELDSKLEVLEKFLEENLRSKEEERKKLATVVWLIKNTGIRVGDEKIAGERGTLGCTTLKKRNIWVDKEKVVLDFIAKDYVHWYLSIKAPRIVRENIEYFREKTNNNSFVFEGLNSGKVAKFLREIIPRLSAKVFRTWIAGKTFEEARKKWEKKLEDKEEFVHKIRFKFINGEIAKKLKHKKKLPKNYEERLNKKLEKIKKLEEDLSTLLEKLKETKGKRKIKLIERIEKKKRRIRKEQLNYEVLKELGEWNLSTSLNNYIDPRRVIRYCKEHNLDISQVYSKSLREKFSWALDDSSNK